MPAIEVTRLARDELRGLIETRQLPADTRERVSRSLLTLGNSLVPASSSRAYGEVAVH